MVDYLNSSPTIVNVPAKHDGNVAFSPSLVELGDQFWNTRVPLSLEFKNDSDGEFKIVDTQASCSCTTPHANYVGLIVPPRSNLIFDVSLVIDKELGLLSRKFGLITSNGHSYYADIRVNVVPTWSVGRDYLDFGDVTTASPDVDDRVLKIDFHSNNECRITEIVGNTSWVTIELRENTGAGTTVYLRLIPAQLKPGNNISTLRIVTNDAHVPEQTLLIAANLVDDLVADISRVFLVGKSSETISFKVRETGEPALIDIAISNSERINARITQDHHVNIEVVQQDFDGDDPEHLLMVRDRDGRVGRVLITAAD